MRWLAFCALAACTTTDDRPQTLAFITETILAPNCANAECHSATKRQNHYVFDSVENAQESLAGTLDGGTGTAGAIVSVCATPPCQVSDSALIRFITVEDAYGNRMPLDHPLANKDIFLIGQWIENGAPGFVAP